MCLLYPSYSSNQTWFKGNLFATDNYDQRLPYAMWKIWLYQVYNYINKTINYQSPLIVKYFLRTPESLMWGMREEITSLNMQSVVCVCLPRPAYSSLVETNIFGQLFAWVKKEEQFMNSRLIWGRGRGGNCWFSIPLTKCATHSR